MPTWALWLIKALWPIMKPVIKRLAEQAWLEVERWMDHNMSRLPKNKTTGAMKGDLWVWKMAENPATRHLAEADLNLLREITHKRMSA